MPGTTISGVHFSPVTLSNAATQNPVYVAIGATISVASSSALVGLSGTDWTITSYALIEGFGDAGTGISLAGSGTIFNKSSATSYGANHGIALGGGGTIFNQGTIAAGVSGTNPGAVYMDQGGYVTNMSGGVIRATSAASDGIEGLGAFAVTVANQGTITAASKGVYIDTGGSVTNQSGGTISAGGNGVELLVAGPSYTGWVGNLSGGTILSGSYGIYVSSGTAINQGYISASSAGLRLTANSTGTNETGGTITAASGTGVQLYGGGSFTNQSGATISAEYGVRVNQGAGAVDNQGSISASNDGIVLSEGGYVTNEAGGIITGSVSGVVASGGATTLLNAGTIAGSGAAGYAVTLATGFTDRLIIDPGAVFLGTVSGGNTIGASHTSTLELASGTSGGTLTGLGSKYVDFAQIIIDAGATWTSTSNVVVTGATLTNLGEVYGALTLAPGAVLTNAAGGLITSSGSAAVYGSNGGPSTLVNAGSIGDSVYYGVSFDAGGIVSNVSGGTITGAEMGVLIYGAGGSVVNAGSIAGGLFAAVELGDGGQVINQTSGVITGYAFAVGVGIFDAGGTVVNDGSIAASFQSAVLLDNGGQVTNRSGGTITGYAGADGVAIYNASGTVTNFGDVTSTGGSAIYVAVAGHVTNQSGGTVVGQNAGIILGTTGTVVNDGSVSGANAAYGGVVLKGGGQVTNQSGGTITGYAGADGVSIHNETGTVTNFGSIGATAATAVYLADGGQVTNRSGGTITGDQAISITGAAGTVSNAGSVGGGNASGQAGVFLADGGLVTNTSGGTITGFYGVDATGAATLTNTSGGTIIGSAAGLRISGAPGTVSNAGRIDAISASSSGVELISGGTVANLDGGTIDGTLYGVESSNIATVTNNGRIGVTAAVAIGISGGMVTNAGTATIAGTSDGIRIYIGGTVVDAGTISGGTDAVYFHAGYSNRLVVDPGAVFIGTLEGGNTVGATATSTLELASGAGAGTLSGLGSKYLDFGAVTIEAAASWTLTGSNTLAAGTTLTNAGELTLSDATLSDAGAVVNNGGIVLDPSTMIVGSLVGTGSVTIDAGATLGVIGTISSGETIVLAGSGAYLDLQSPLSVAGSITDFGLGETIDLKGIAPGSVSYSGGELLINGVPGFPLALAPGNTLQIGSSSDGTDLTAICFCADTLISTPSGQVKVQDLSAGDLVTTWRGQARPIVWIGTGAVLATRGRRNAATPVVVRKGALGDNVPTRNLRVTKGHALYVDDVLIPVEFLVNHRSIVWDDRAQEVKLFHIELQTHDVLIANGAPAESYRDDGNRWLFRNANSGWHLPPREPCAPVLTGGPVVDAVWSRLLTRAGPRPGLRLTDDPDLHLLVGGNRVDAASRLGAYVFRLASRASLAHASSAHASSARASSVIPSSACPFPVRIISRAGAPAELGLARDPRVLGVALRRIALHQAMRCRVIEAEDPVLAKGFHAFEPDNGLRWTNGDATVPAGLFDGFDGPMELVLHVGCTTQYPLFGEPEAHAAS